MGKSELVQLNIKSFRTVRNARPAGFFLSAILGSCLLLALSFGCGPPSSSGDDKQGSPGSASSGLPELTEELIRERINDTYVREVPEDGGTGEPIGWGFDEDEPKEIVVVEKQVDGPRATVVLDVKTTSGPRSRTPRYLAGQIRTEWKLETGWALRRWEIVDTENISMKYKNLPKPPAQNSNR